MKERIAVYLLLVSLIVIVFYAINTINMPIMPEIKILEKVVDRVIVKGHVLSTNKETLKEEKFNFELNLKKLPGEEKFTLDYDKSLLPRAMVVDSVKTETKYDFLAPFRVGVGAHYDDDELDKDLICGYILIRSKHLEAGLVTDFESVGVLGAYRIGNISLGGYATLAGTVGLGVTVKPF